MRQKLNLCLLRRHDHRKVTGSETEGLRSVIFKAGQRNLVNNYRGITVHSIFGKIFEILVHFRMTFLNEAFWKVHEFNGGFLRGYRTTDNIFVLNGLVQRQIAMGKPYATLIFQCHLTWSTGIYYFMN